jgi:hypothetical protein
MADTLCGVTHRLLEFFGCFRGVVSFEESDNVSFRFLIFDAKLEPVAFDGEDATVRNLETQGARSVFVMEHSHGFAADMADRLRGDVLQFDGHVAVLAKNVGIVNR